MKSIQFDWVACPICEEEWTKLRPCLYFVDGEKRITHFCVQCAETVKSIHEISKRFPIEGVEIVTGHLGPAFATSKIGGEIHTEPLYRNKFAKISLGGLTIGLRSSSSNGIEVTVGENDPRYVDNIMAAWFLSKHMFEKYSDPGELEFDPGPSKAKTPGKKRGSKTRINNLGVLK